MSIDREQYDPEKDLFVGIDLGTSNSVISFWDPIQERMVSFGTDYAKFVMPSVVSYDKNEKKWLFGSRALNRREMFPELTVSSIKRHMGESYKTCEIAGKFWTPVEISRMLVERLVAYAEGKPRGQGPVPGSMIRHVVICHPYDFNQEAKKRTRESAITALREVKVDNVQLIEEPTAAALGFGVLHGLDHGETVMVFDLGGGTFDITIFQALISPEKELVLKVLALEGDEHLGGDDFDEVLMELLRDRWKELGGFEVDLAGDSPRERRLRQYVRQCAEQAKIFLADAALYNVLLLDPEDPTGEPVSFDVSQQQFNTLSEELFDRVERKCRDAVATARDHGLDGQVDHVLLVGGSTNMTRIQSAVFNVFGKLPAAPYDRATIVSRGAALYSAICGQVTAGASFKTLPYSNIRIENILPHPIGVQARVGGREVFVQVFAKGTRFPVASNPIPFRIDGTTMEETLPIWEVRSSDNVNHRDITEIETKYKGLMIGQPAFSGTDGTPRRITIRFQILEDGILLGKFKDPEMGREQDFDIGKFIDTTHHL